MLTKLGMLLVVVGTLAGCGAPQKMVTTGPAFVNQTEVSDAVLGGEWQQAQSELATKPIYINAATNHTPQYLSPDTRAYKVEPHEVVVEGVKDALWSELPPDIQQALAGQNVHGDPTGVYFKLACSCYVHGETKLGSRPHVWVAASGAGRLAEYEFENVILYQLGYNVEGR